MQLTIKSLTRQTSIYGFFQIIQRSVSFVVIPLYTYYLTPDEFGSLDILYLIVMFVGIIGGSKLDAAFVRYYAAANANDTVSKLLSSSILGVILFSTGFCVLAALCAGPILTFMFSSKSVSATGYYLALMATWLELVGSLPLAYLRVRHEARLVGSISLVQALIGTAVGLFCVTILHIGYQGILLGIVASGVVLVTASYWTLLKRISLSLDFSYGPILLKYALPMLPAPIFMYLLNYSDRYFLLKYWSLGEVGVYAMGYKFAMLMNLLIMGPFGEMWGANQFSLYENKQKQTYERLALLYVSLLCQAALCISYFSYEITVVALNSAFHGLLSIVVPLTVGVALWGIVPTLDLGCQIRNKTWLRSFTTGVAALGNILLNWQLIPTFGPLGAALATLISFMMLTIITHIFNQKLTDYSLNVGKFTKLFIIFCLLSSLMYIRDYVTYITFIIIRFVALFLFTYIILLINNIKISYFMKSFAKKSKAIQL